MRRATSIIGLIAVVLSAGCGKRGSESPAAQHPVNGSDEKIQNLYMGFGAQRTISQWGPYLHVPT
jgi:hypothetical protein